MEDPDGGEDDDEGEDIDAQIAALHAAQISKSSRVMYTNSSIRHIQFLFIHHRDQLGDAFLAGISDLQEGPTTAYIRSVLGPPVDLSRPPLKFETFNVDAFLSWILTLKKSPSTCSTHRSALFNLFRDFNVPMSPFAKARLAGGFKGLKRQNALDVAAGAGRIQVGKEPLDFSMYRWIAEQFMRSDKKDNIFAHCCLTLSWNLMCRVGNAVNICWSHLSWHEDALAVYFAHMKNDQTGERPRDARHVYANPLNPVICPILSLAIYMVCFPLDVSIPQMFPGGKQDDRYSKCLGRLLRETIAAEELQRRGMQPDDIGTHSTRKGSATYCASGTTAAPPTAAVCLRAGWSMPGVMNTYLRHSEAGDQQVGRVSCGLPTDSAQFAILPPFFSDRSDIDDAIKMCFPFLPPNLGRVAEFALASLVYHRDFLRATLPDRHPLFSSTLFRTSGLLESLAPKVACRLARPTDPLTATGVTPQAIVLRRLESIEIFCEELRQSVERQPSNIRVILEDVLERRAVHAAAVTPQSLHTVLMEVLERSGILRTMERLNSGEHLGAAAAAAAGPAAALAPPRFPVYTWGGRLNMLPETFEFPPGAGPQQAWLYYMCGDSSKGYPPLRKVTERDIFQKSTRKRFCDFKFVMKFLECKARDDGIWLDEPTVIQANSIYERVKSVVEVRITPQNRKRRVGQLSWKTVANVLRAKKLRPGHEEHDDASGDEVAQAAEELSGSEHNSHDDGE